MIRFEFWHDGEQLYWAQYDNCGFVRKIKIIWCLFTTGVVCMKGTGKATRRVGGKEYKL